MSSDEIISDFRIFPTHGDAPLPVGIAMRQKGRFARTTCDFGDSTPQKDTLVINHTYSNAGTYDGRIDVFENMHDTAPKQTILFTVTVNDSPKTKFIESIRQNDGAAITYTDRSTQFTIEYHDVVGPGAFDDITWNFGDGTPDERPSKKAASTCHTYKKEGNYIVTVTVKKRKFDPAKKQTVVETDSKSCGVMVLPDGYS